MNYLNNARNVLKLFKDKSLGLERMIVRADLASNMNTFNYKNKLITVENLFQASKALDEETKLLMLSLNPFDAKRMGKKLPIDINAWDKDKVAVMDLMISFRVECDDRLLQLDLPYSHNNYWNDTFWGICNGKGQDVVGKLYTNKIKERKLK